MAFEEPIVCPLETHLTLAPASEESLPRAAQWAAAQGLKWTHILLAEGRHPSQPMVTFWRSGTLGEQLDQAAAIAASLRELDLLAVRVKVECASADAARYFENSLQLAEHPGYFEHHVKLQLAADAELPALAELARTHDARLSANARRQLAAGAVERFVTQRAYDAGRAEAAERLAQLIDSLQAAAYPILEVEEEYVLYDSDLQLDAGWL
ncbi:hypothetical protein [Blastopirellula marina]|uniref:Uncharacterized protein n=1 Tax=Blastopirellula marina TaxID=124 RepID=A0A2S8GG09_9BACT|nr:hypothetical protein [Blastopirellula marina]PQO43220.1 hypothetical protein C5Y93_26330 [Blastopirellula marina]